MTWHKWHYWHYWHDKLGKVGKVEREVCQDGQLCHAKNYMTQLAQFLAARARLFGTDEEVCQECQECHANF